MLPEVVKKDIETYLNSTIINAQSIGGGCISSAYKISLSNNHIFFVKINPKSGNMFSKESNGLIELNKAEVIRIPCVHRYTNDYILLEHIDSAPKTLSFYSDFGKSLAQLHKYSSDKFGFSEDNYIGSNIQKNTQSDDWAQFYFENRILFQLKLAEKNNLDTKELTVAISKLENKIQPLLESSLEAPSLLHGDLWSGNYITDEKGNACLIDPAVYYGHREADLAMTKLFGGFPPEFYGAYQKEFPLPKGWKHRESLYKLYHIMNHLNLFGQSYYNECMSLIRNYI